MDDLIEALQIFRKYANEKWPTNCANDVMYIMGVEPNLVSETDKERLDELGFMSSEDDGFFSFRFGSA